mgnify:FL=1
MIVGASFDTVEAQKNFADEQGFGYRLLADTTKEVGQAYEVEAEYGLPLRVTYLIDPEGTIMRVYDLKGQDLEAHAGMVLDDVRTLS